MKEEKKKTSIHIVGLSSPPPPPRQKKLNSTLTRVLQIDYDPVGRIDSVDRQIPPRSQPMTGHRVREIGIRSRGKGHGYPPLVVVDVPVVVIDRPEMLLRQYRLAGVVLPGNAHHGEVPLCCPRVHYHLQFVIVVRDV